MDTFKVFVQTCHDLGFVGTGLLAGIQQSFHSVIKNAKTRSEETFSLCQIRTSLIKEIVRSVAELWIYC